MAGKGAPEGNDFARKENAGFTISLYLNENDMKLLRLVLAQHGLSTHDNECRKWAKKAAKAGINSLLLSAFAEQIFNKEESEKEMKLALSSWIGNELFEAVCAEFKERGYKPPSPDTPGGTGAYASNIARQYMADLNEQEVLNIIARAGDNRELPYRQQIQERRYQ